MLTVGVQILCLATCLQIVFIFERCLYATISLLVGVPQESTLPAKLLISSALSWVTQVIAILASTATIILNFLLRNFLSALFLLLCVFVFFVLGQAGPRLFVLFVNVYNAGLGVLIDSTVIKALQMVDLLLTPLVALYNGFVYWYLETLKIVLLPLLQQNVNLLPELAQNVTLALASLTYSFNIMLSRVLECAISSGGSVSVTDDVPFDDAAALQCFSNSNYMSLDLITPGAYTKQSIQTVIAISFSSCSAISDLVQVLMYPLLDYNLYHSVHCGVNMILQVFVQGISVSRRCEYAKSLSARFSKLDEAVMCSLDWHVPMQYMIQAGLSLGKCIDNWLDVFVYIVESSYTDRSPRCEKQRLEIVGARLNASMVLPRGEILRPVGLTPELVAFTDGNSTLYHSRGRNSWALYNWPVEIEPEFGVASVQWLSFGDEDSVGNPSTGMFGCRCDDTDRGITILCASVPFQYEFDDDNFMSSTIHELEFDHSMALHGMACATTVIHVSSMRYSRNRFSLNVDGIESGLHDAFDVAPLTPASDATADAIIVVRPLCKLEGGTSRSCLQNEQNCFPYCMGLHIAGRQNARIFMYNARTWRETVMLQQTECATVRDDTCALGSGSQLVSEGIDATIRLRDSCVFDGRRCSLESKATTLQSYSDGKIDQDYGESVLRDTTQPFVVAGDIMLFEEQDNVVVRRLFNTNKGMQQERLRVSESARRIAIKNCQEGDEACYVSAVRSNQVVMPRAFFRTTEIARRPVALSRWAVHWAVNPELSVLQQQFESCRSGGSGGVFVSSSLARARVWTLQGFRSSFTMGKQYEGEAPVAHYMIVPEFVSAESPCNAVVNMAVVSLETIDEENVMITTLAARKQDWDVLRGEVYKGAEQEYRHYFLSPNDHSCILPDVDEPIFTCWQNAEVGLFVARNAVSELPIGTTCQALQRTPKIGSMTGHTWAAGVVVLKSILELIFVVPAILAKEEAAMGEIFSIRDYYTHVAILDNSGETFLDLDYIFKQLHLSAVHTWQTLEKLSLYFSGSPADWLVENVMLGTARIMQNSKQADVYSDALLKQLTQVSSAKSTEYVQALQEMLTSVSEKLPALPSPIIQIQKMVVSGISTMRLNVKLLRRWIVYALKRSSGSGQTASKVRLSRVISDIRQDIKIFVLEPLDTQCTGYGMVLGLHNPLAQSVVQACRAVKDGMAGAVDALGILFSEYPTLQCVCGNEHTGNVDTEALEVCLAEEHSYVTSVWTIDYIATASLEVKRAMCFKTMDHLNEKFTNAFEPMFKRLGLLADALGSSLDYLVSVFNEDTGQCIDGYLSPFVVTILPSPLDYFLGCHRTASCRADCRDNFEAFEDARANAASIEPLYFEHTAQMTVRSKFFSTEDIEAKRHLSPFDVKSVVELESTTCEHICAYTDKLRCLAAAGLKHGEAQIVYTCLPRDNSMFAYESPLYTRNETMSFYPTAGGAVHAMYFLTRAATLDHRRETLLVLHQNKEQDEREVVRLGIMTPRINLFSPLYFEILQTAEYDPQVADTRLNQISQVRVIPSRIATEKAHLYVKGSKTVVYVDGVVRERTDEICWRAVVPTDPLRPTFAIEVASLQYSSVQCDLVFSEQHQIVCLDGDCEKEVWLPLQKSRAVIVRTMDHNLTQETTESVLYEPVTRMGHQIAHHLQISREQPLYLTAYGQAVENIRRTSPVASAGGDLKDFTVLTAGGNTAAGEGWIQNTRLQLKNQEFRGTVTEADIELKNVAIKLDCTLDNCVGCQRNPPEEQFVDLQSKCYAAQQCALQRCVGTTVNINRPLCNVGMMYATSVKLVRAGVQGVWRILAEFVVTTVELTYARRQKYVMDWPEEIFMDAVCTLKDSTVEMSGIVVSSLSSVVHGISKSMSTYRAAERGSVGRDPLRSLDISDDTLQTSRQRSSLSDPRFSARFFMAAQAFCSLLSSLLMLPLYGFMMIQKIFVCSSDDMIMTVQRIADLDVISLQSSSLHETAENQLTSCMSGHLSERLRDLGRVEFSDEDMASSLTEIKDLATRMPFEMIKQAMDTSIAYYLGVVNGLLDVSQTLDYSNCKLPDISTVRIDKCVCGDKPVQIPASRRRESLLWCVGPTMVADVMGREHLRWNRYSLHQLLEAGDYDAYIDCLGSEQDCGHLRPYLSDLRVQNVEAMQMINLCRANYQQGSWNEAVVLLGVFSAQEWATFLAADNAGRLAQIGAKNDRFQNIRMQFFDVAEFIRDTMPPPAVLDCLHQNLQNGAGSASCFKTLIVDVPSSEYYVYEDVPTGSVFEYKNIDACETFSGSVSSVSKTTEAGRPRNLWMESKTNSEIVGVLHPKLGSQSSERISSAETEIKDYLEEVVKPFLRDVPASIQSDFKLDAWLTEGDNIHQIVDCFVMGPYASAEMHVDVPGGQNAPLYYRADASSRLFDSESLTSGQTGGSPARQKIMKAVKERVLHNLQNSIAIDSAVDDFLKQMLSVWSSTQFIFCTCDDQTTSLRCCSGKGWKKIEDISFVAGALLESQDLQDTVFADILTEVLSSDILSEQIWENEMFVPDVPEYTMEEKLELRELSAFRYGSTTQAYSVNEVMQSLTPLKTFCEQIQLHKFYTLPLRVDLSGVDLPDADFSYNPTSDTTTGYMHGMEEVIGKLLDRARRDSPVFWSHVHRYVPSDSMWCESSAPLGQQGAGQEASFAETTLLSPSQRQRADEAARRFNVTALSDIVFPADLTSRCLCWTPAADSATGCPVPAEIDCVQPDLEPDELRIAWHALCATGTYSTVDEQYVLMRVLRSLNVEHLCMRQLASLGWLSEEELIKFYNGSVPEPLLDMRQILSYGPSGVRGAMFVAGDVPGSEMLESDPTNQVFSASLGHSIAQPVCESTLQNVLVDDLRGYFKDTFFPMAHSIEVPVYQAYCDNWAVEFAVWYHLDKVLDASDKNLLEQLRLVQIWQKRCDLKLREVGLCHLRNMAPADMMHVSDEVKLDSLHWPEYITSQETAALFTPEDYQPLLDAIRTHKQTTTYESNDLLANAFARVRAQDTAKVEGEAPAGQCGDLFDYWPQDAQHPVGYHPTPAARASDTQLRGFTAWMSMSDLNELQVDPYRMRNNSHAALFYGAGSHVCDAGLYGKIMHEPDSYFLQTKWNPDTPVDAYTPTTKGPEPETTMHTKGENLLKWADETSLLNKQSNNMFKHQVGLVRNLIRLSDQDEQQEVDSHWPLVINDKEVYGTESTADCVEPVQLECENDSQCGPGLKCLMADGVGVCDKPSACFRHSHCADGTMCSVLGACEEPHLIVHNEMGVDVDLYLHADIDDTPSAGYSEYEGASDFASANGQCSLSNWRSYAGHTAQKQIEPIYFNGAFKGFAHRMRDRETQNIDGDTTLLSDTGWYQILPHVCELDYEHGLFDFVTDASVSVSQADMQDQTDVYSDLEMSRVSQMRTWRLTDTDGGSGMEYLLCDINTDNETGLVDPYYFYNAGVNERSATLSYVTDTVKRCDDFQTCQSYAFEVNGEFVQERRVYALTRSENSFGILLTPKIVRAYNNLDATYCLSQGMLFSYAEKICVLDVLASPVAAVVLVPSANADEFEWPVFNALVSDDDARKWFDTIRSSCPRAFGSEYEKSFALFKTIREVVMFEYTPEFSKNIQRYVNKLLALLFGVDAESGNGRGLQNSFAKYDQHVSCAQFLDQRLQLLHAKIESDGVNPYPRESQYPSLVPGYSMYMFYERAPVYTPFRWLWQCVLLTTPEEGGAPHWWFKEMDQTQVQNTGADRTIACDVYKTDMTIEEDVTVQELLQRSPYVWTMQEDLSQSSILLQQDFQDAFRRAIDELNLAFAPDLQCLEEIKTDCLGIDVFPTLQKITTNTACWRKLSLYNYSAIPAESRDVSDSLYRRVLQRLFGIEDELELIDYNVQTSNYVSERTMASRITLNSRFVPMLIFADANDDPATFELQRSIDGTRLTYSDGVTYAEKTHTGDSCPWLLSSNEYRIQDPCKFDSLEAQYSNTACSQSAVAFKGVSQAASMNDDVYLTQAQAEFLVLRYIKQDLFTEQSFRSEILEMQEYKFKNLMATQEHSSFNYLAAFDFNNHLKSRPFECSPEVTINQYRETNTAHSDLRACHDVLSDAVGWTLKRDSFWHASPHASEKTRLASLLQKGFYPSFKESSTAEDPKNTRGFVREMVKRELATNSRLSSNHYCFLTSDGVEVLNPLWTGAFNLDIGCETLRVENSLYEITDLDRTSSLCASRAKEMLFVANPGTLRDGIPPLCTREIKQEVRCSRRHGSLGGNVGSPLKSVFDNMNVTIQAGVFSQSNSIFRGAVFRPQTLSTAQALQVLASDIGGHIPHFVVEKSTESIVLRYMHSAYPADDKWGSFVTSLTTDQWMSRIEESWAFEHAQQRQYHSVASDTLSQSWTCPLQRVMRYSSLYSSTEFKGMRSPFLQPSAVRNQIRFKHITKDHFFAHPLVSSQYEVDYLTHPLWLSEIFACVDKSTTQCHSDSASQPLLQKTIDFLLEQNWVSFQAIPPATGWCTHHIDWPHNKFVARDMRAFPINSEEDAKLHDCSILNRLPDFKVRVEKQPRNHARSRGRRVASTDKDGPCHMGRLRRVGDFAADKTIQHCQQDLETATCQRANASTLTYDSVDSRIERTQIPDADILCRDAESWPTTFVDRQNVKTDLESKLLSIGRPVDLKTARMLASYVRRELCVGVDEQTCEERLLKVLPTEDAWLMSNFLERFFENVTGSFTISSAEDDSMLWSRPWVFCKSPDSACEGSISRENWINSTRRTEQCVSHAYSAAQSSARNKIDFCLLNPTHEQLCQEARAWRTHISQIICRAFELQGCSDSRFFYSPTAFSVADKSFVHDIVNRVYNLYDDEGMCAQDTNRLQKDQLEANDQALGKCASKFIEPMRVLLQRLREIRVFIIEIFFYLVKIQQSLVEMLVSVVLVSSDMMLSAVYRFSTFVGMLMMAVLDLVVEIATVLFKVIFVKGSLPYEIVRLLTEYVCPFLEWVNVNIVGTSVDTTGTLCWIFWNIGGILIEISRALTSIADVSIPLGVTELRPFNDLLGPAAQMIDSAGVGIRAVLPCRPRTNECEFDFFEDEEVVGGTLPVATRCWSTYTTFFGDGDSLSCSKADTCRRSELSLEDDLVPCGACGAGAFGLHSYACSYLTKTCTCQVPRYERTQCTSNSDCIQADSCAFVNRFNMPGSGSAPCWSCQQNRFCYMPTASGVGYCACGLSPIEYSRCQDDYVIPNDDRMCLFDMNLRFMTAVATQQEFGALVSTPCSNVLTSHVRCMQIVEADGSTSGRFIVAGKVFRGGGRRLLQDIATENASVVFQHNALCLDAFQADTLTHVRLACSAQLRDSQLTVKLLNLSHALPPCTFCDLNSFAHALIAVPMAPFIISLSPPRVWLLLHRHAGLKTVQQTIRAWLDTIDVYTHDLRNTSRPVNTSNLSQEQLWQMLSRPLVGSRRLLQVSFVQDVESMIQRATGRASVIASAYNYKFPSLSGFVPDLWNDQFPPVLTPSNTDKCTPLYDLAEVARHSANGTLKFFLTTKTPPPHSLHAAWPAIMSSDTVLEEAADVEDLLTEIVKWTADLIAEWVNIDRRSVSDWAESVITETVHLTRCDFEAIQTCSRWKVRLASGTVIVGIWFAIWFVICNALGFGFLATLTMPLFSLLLPYVCYGYTWTCLPMIPTCALQDFHETLSEIFPKYIKLDAVFFKNSSCADDALVDASCLRSCQDVPWNYSDWRQVLAWISAELGRGFSSSLMDLLSYVPFFDIEYFEEEVGIRIKMWESSSTSVVLGNRICTVFNLYRILPYLLLALLVVGVAALVLQAFLTLLYPSANLLLTLYVCYFES